ncbi:FxLD family lanthipeptide [Sphaerimonospora cavernae]|uniref:FxLD family lanthipeptide n=1 Tax=Sphaerimonospora cavernae TaxID=1740611 RepID=A0ABV6U1A8_9ACTN
MSIINGVPVGAPTLSPFFPGQSPTLSPYQGSATRSPFDLDVTVAEVADPAGLVNVTDDGCTSTCGACVTGAA